MNMQELDHGFKKALQTFADIKAKDSIDNGTPGHAALERDIVIDLGKLVNNAYPHGGLDTDVASSLISLLSNTSLEMASRSKISNLLWAKVGGGPEAPKQLLGQTHKTWRRNRKSRGTRGSPTSHL